MPSPPDQEFFAQGVPVEVGRIQRELKKLWQDSHESATRASRLNLVIFSSAEHSLRANTALVEQIAHQHALRAILIAAKPQYTGTRVRAWINAHCQISKSGAKLRCSEQIAFQLEGEARQMGLTPSLIFSNLDSDLPLYLWRQGEFSTSPSRELMAWVDCLLFDSADWPQPAAQFSIIRKLAAEARLENGMADLNWTRLSGLRLAIAQFFDGPGALDALDKLDALEITHAAGTRTRALLLAGWFAARLGWVAGNEPGAFEASGGRRLKLTLKEREGAGIGRVELRVADGRRFTVSREGNSAFFNTCVSGANRCDLCQVLPVGSEETADLVSEELATCGGHRSYLKAMEAVEGCL